MEQMNGRLRRFTGRLRAVAEDLQNRFLVLKGRREAVRYDIRCPKLVLGRGDGRWCIDITGLNSDSVVYSAGVGYDISFDLDLIHLTGCRVHAFDPTVLAAEWLTTVRFPGKFSFHRIGLAHFDGEALFRLPPKHAVSFSMNKEVAGGSEHSAPVKTLGRIMDELGTAKIDLLKIDIEGAEYEVIPDLVKHASRIAQLQLEFHSRLLPGNGEALTRSAIQTLRDAGFRLFHISPRGLEHSFLGPAPRLPGR